MDSRIRLSGGTLAGLGAVLLAALLFRQLGAPLLLLFGALLLGTALDRFAVHIAERSPLPRAAALVLILAGGVLCAGLAGWLYGPRLVDQIWQVLCEIPSAAQDVLRTLEERGWISSERGDESVLSDLGPRVEDLLGRLATTLSAGGGILAATAVVLVVGLYLAATPDRYVGGFLLLVPRERRARAAEVLEVLGSGLGWWVVGRLFSMTITALLTSLGLWLIGMPMPWALGVLTGLLSFVPYLGPVAAAVPIGAVAWGVGGPMLAKSIGVLAGVQLIESNLLTPLAVQKAVALPAAVLLGGQFLMGTLAGLPGVLFAAPLTVTVIILVQLLYVEDRLGEEVTPLGDHSE